MAWYDTIVDIKNTAVEFLKNDTVQDIASVASVNCLPVGCIACAIAL